MIPSSPALLLRPTPKIVAAGVAPFALDGTPVFTNSSSSAALQIGSPIVTSYANSLILIPIITNSAGVSGVADGTNTYARVTGLSTANAGGTIIDCWFTIAAAAGSYQPTVSTSGAAFITIGAVGVSGTKTSSIFETPNSTATGTNATFTTVNADTFMLGFDVSPSGSPLNGFTNITPSSASNFLYANYKIETVTRSGYTYDSANGNCSIAVAAIKGP